MKEKKSLPFLVHLFIRKDKKESLILLSIRGNMPNKWNSFNDNSAKFNYFKLEDKIKSSMKKRYKE